MQHAKKEISVKEDNTTNKLINLEDVIGSYYQELNTTEGILSELSIMLTNYHDKLKEVSKQVKIMQDKSETYRIKLANRKELVE